MAYVTAEARQGLLDAVAAAVDDIGVALSALGDAYELLDDAMGDQLEDALFGPVQSAYGRAKRTHSGFAERHDLAPRTFVAPPPGPPSRGVKGFVEQASDAVQRADHALATLQDSMLGYEIGDAELRDGIADVRRRLDGVPSRARELTRRFGR